MADVDKLSAHFLELQEAGVAAIWRPLHEAAGGWFWWGVGGAECYKALYKLVYDRMTNTNGVKNLIWVWNIERDPAIGYDFGALNPAWYPGDEYVDIIVWIFTTMPTTIPRTLNTSIKWWMSSAQKKCSP